MRKFQKITNLVYEDKMNWLGRSINLEADLAALQQSFNKAQSDAGAIASLLLVGKPEEKGRPKYDKLLDSIAEYSVEIAQAICDIYTSKKEILIALMKVKTPSHRQLLQLRYLNGETWDNIAVLLHYSYDYVKRELLFAALDEFELPNK